MLIQTDGFSPLPHFSVMCNSDADSYLCARQPCFHGERTGKREGEIM